MLDVETRPHSVFHLLPFAFAIICVLATYLFVGSRELTLPGVYMDAVNPDYLVVKLLNRHHAEPLVAWVLPGNYLRNRVPVLISLYHGLQQFWLGLPLYAIFGTSVVGIRLTHMVFAAGVLIGMLVLLRKAGVAVWICALCGIAVAVDPSFVFAFRTQSYITMAPVMWLLFSIYALFQAEDCRTTWRACFFLASGACFGFAVLGYFVYAFYVPVLLLAIGLWSPRESEAVPFVRARANAMVMWLVGAMLGSAYYLVGYALVARAHGGGIGGFLSYVAEYSARLDAFGAALSMEARLATAWAFLRSVFTNGWHHSLMFGSAEPVPFSSLKLVILAALPILFLLYAEFSHRASRILRIAVGLPVCFFVVSLVFGERLGGHHYMSLLPISYVALAAAPAAVWPDKSTGSIVAAFCLGILVAINGFALDREFATLRRTGGVGLFSDAVNHLAIDLASLSPEPFVYFPDWGLAFPVTLISGGTIPSSTDIDVGEARRVLCSGKDVAIAMVGDDRSRIATWADRFHWGPPRVTPYRQRDGAIVIDLVTFTGSPDNPACRS
jgi:hypothetical protein